MSAAEAFEESEPDQVDLTLPARPEMRVVARMTASAVAARVGFDYEEIADLRLAIDELCTSCSRGVGDGRLHLSFSFEEGGLRVDCLVVPDPADSPGSRAASGEARRQADEEEDGDELGLSAAEFSDQILSALTDEHGLLDAGDGRRGWLRKRRSTA